MNSAAHDGVIRGNDYARAWQDRVSDAVGLVTDQLRGAAKSADGFVRSSPWRAVGALALAGLAAGMLMSLGRRRRRNADATEDVDPEVGG
jgi:ElaB/YqjD/DUF883 family membrane-anchored ribosome-binding protein